MQIRQGTKRFLDNGLGFAGTEDGFGFGLAEDVGDFIGGAEGIDRDDDAPVAPNGEENGNPFGAVFREEDDPFAGIELRTYDNLAPNVVAALYATLEPGDD